MYAWICDIMYTQDMRQYSSTASRLADTQDECAAFTLSKRLFAMHMIVL